ncbi:MULTISPECIES: MMPL family transporter [unclassified Streptomyces]|uniref:MMPL family transporter n=1 Tax=unclassified Streptomyces TaxID=2593676 RepID=UPI001F39DB26|nr:MULTISPECIES: MMPL family transporter [unclassified Streptomyces]MCF0088154.1 putative membrane protein YdgH [Streptomyces sp. MH192]MCF0099136.1 putative membrane protein YdgH [Streptomyces sp. MH191]
MSPAARRARRLVPVLLIVLVWLCLGGILGPFAGRLGEVATNDQAAFLPRSAESTEVIEEQKAFKQRESLPVIVVWTAEDGGTVASRRGEATRALATLTDAPGLAGRASPAVLSSDKEALQGVVPLRPDLGDGLSPALDRVREAADRVPGTTVRLAGPAATQADLSDAFSGIDGLLLGVALITVLVILLLVYRSVLLPLLIILGAVFALGVACAIVYVLADHGVVRVDGQVQGILSILVIGAATDYALLLTARFREELGAREDRFAAARAALRRSWSTIAASAATVALGLLALLLSDLTNNRALGPVGAVGIVCAVLSTLTFLPAVLALLGRAAFWPAKPKAHRERETANGSGKDTASDTGQDSRQDSGQGSGQGSRQEEGGVGGQGLWPRVAGLVDRAPRRVWAFTLVALLACAAFAPTLSSKGVPLDETFVNDAPSVAAQQTLGQHFPGGSGNPAVIIAEADRYEEVLAAARDTRGVDSAAGVSDSGRPGGKPQEVDGRVRIDATLAGPADGEAAQNTVARLREAVHAVPDADALVGGYTAQRYDTLRTAEHDRTLIVPVVLAIILVILMGLLRSLVMPVLLVATVALSFLATLGVSSLVFTHVFGFTGTDPSVPLYGFVFLVALGVDYNIFLMSRAREETLRFGVRQGVLRALVATGGVITSAGVVLAATFAALGVIPLAFLVQVAFIVAFGVLLDTLAVRSLLVPALVRDAGPRAWWPARFGGSAEREDRTHP